MPMKEKLPTGMIYSRRTGVSVSSPRRTLSAYQS